MKTKTMIAAVMALSMAFGSTAYAQGMSHGQSSHQQRGGDNRQGSDNNGRQGHDDRGNSKKKNYGHQKRDHYQGDRGHQQARGAGPNHNFYRGAKLPSSYRNKQYVVNDWRGHRLHVPPRGQQWIQVGGDYVLVAIATGLIMSVLLN